MRAGDVKSMNNNGCGRMELNILVLQQNLKNIEANADLKRAAKFFDLFMDGPEKILEQAKEERDAGKAHVFGLEEMKTLVELCYSEDKNNPERGISSVAVRKMNDNTLQLDEIYFGG